MGRTLLSNRLRSTLYLDETREGVRVLKVLHAEQPSRQELARFDNELRITASLDVPGVRRAHGIEHLEGRPALVLDHVDGTALDMLIPPSGLDLDGFFALARPIAELLGRIHNGRVVHSDVKPANLVIGEDGTPWMIDFGLSFEAGGSHHSGGTAAYMSPEQTGRTGRTVDARSDLYALGITFYEMLAGSTPFATKSGIELVHAHMATPPPAVPAPAPLAALIAKLLAKEPDARYQSASGVARDLAALERMHLEGSWRSLTLGEGDHPTQFRLTGRLYGRQSALDVLSRALLEARQQSRWMMVAGESGSGKSAVVAALQAKSGAEIFWLDGKFDQIGSNMPYSAVSSAFDALARRVLSRPDREVEALRQAVRAEIGDLSSVLEGLCPRLGVLLGPAPPPPALAGESEERNRLHYLVRRLLDITARERPIVLFLDDLQWADFGTLDLLESLAADLDLRNLLVIGCYRSDELHDEHPLAQTLTELPVQTVRLGPLGVDDVTALIHDATNNRCAGAPVLAAAVHRKTGGNPFFTWRFLLELAREGGLHATDDVWSFDLSQLEGMHSTENVVAFMAARVAELPASTINVLRRAACMGNRFDLAGLARVVDRKEDTVEELLRPAIELELVSPDSRGLQFAHDRIQQAVYEAMPQVERTHTHADIGRLLLQRSSEAEQREKLFEITRQLNLGLDAIREPALLDQLAHLNLEAGRRAKAGAAYSAACDHLVITRTLLDARPDAWSTYYTTLLEVYSELAASAHLAERIPLMQEVAEQLLTHARTPRDGVVATEVLLQQALKDQDYQKAINVGVEGLDRFGITFPRRPKLHHILLALGRVKLRTFRMATESLVDLPRMTDPDLEAAMRLMDRLTPAAFRLGSHLFPLITLRMLDLTIVHGNTPASVFAFAAFGITLAGVVGDIDGGFAYGELAQQVVGRLRADAWETKAIFIHHNFIMHWKRPLQNGIDGLDRGFRSGQRTGNKYEGLWCAFYGVNWRFHLDTSLPDVEFRLDQRDALFATDQAVHANARLLRQVALNLMDPDHPTPWALEGERFHHTDDTRRMAEGRDLTGLCTAHLSHAQLLYLFDRPEEAAQALERARPYLEAITGMFSTTVFVFYDGLIALEVARKANAGVPSSLRGVLKKLRKWATHSPLNQSHRVLLLEAESAWLGGDHLTAAPIYEAAITAAGRSRMLGEEALCLERAAMFYAAQDRRMPARLFLDNALKAYERWGALAKVHDLAVRFPNLARPVLIDRGGLTGTSTGTLDGGPLDLQSVLRANQALAGEIVLDELLARLMRVLLENAGAERALLVLDRDGTLTVAAIAEKGEVVVADVDAIIPRTLVDYVRRTSEDVLIGDVSHDRLIASDPYFEQHPARSVLASPLMHRNALLGVILLEHHSLVDAFTAERLQMVRLLSGQAGTSVRNAQLYASLQAALATQGAMLEAAKRFVPFEYLASLDRTDLTEVRLGDSVHKEMSILFSDIRGFTTIVEQHETSGRLLSFINEYLSHAEPHLLDAGGFIDSYNGDGVMALFNDAAMAIRGAIAMQKGLARYNANRLARDEPAVRTGIGISTGPVMLGTIGGERRIKCGVIGDPVNTAARVESLTKRYGAALLVTHHTLERLGPDAHFACRQVDRIRVVGKNRPIVLYQVLDAEDEGTRTRLHALNPRWDAALEHYYAGDFADASAAFGALETELPNDLPCALFRERCSAYAEAPPGYEWDGTDTATIK